jgi:hypothetical protein
MFFVIYFCDNKVNVSELVFKDLPASGTKITFDLFNKYSDKLTKLVAHSTIDCLDKPSVVSPEDLIYQFIYPYRFVPNIDGDACTYITMRFGGFETSKLKSFKSTFKFGKLFISISYLFQKV